MRELTFESPLITFRFPEKWHVEVIDDVISVFNEIDGVGALQFSLYPAEGVKIAEHRIILEKVLNRESGTYEIEESEDRLFVQVRPDDGRIWQHWVFRTSSVIVYATYNCLREHSGREQAEVERILESVGGGVVEPGVL